MSMLIEIIEKTLRKEGLSKTGNIVLDQRRCDAVFRQQRLKALSLSVLLFTIFVFLGNAAIARGPLELAILAEDVATVERLLNEGVEPVGMYDAIYVGNAVIVGLLLDAGLDPNLSGGGGFTPLMKAASKGDQEIAVLLLEHGADPNAASHKYKLTALGNAIAGQHNDIVSLLIDAGADVSGRDGWQNTPLMVAAKAGNNEAARLLLAEGSDPSETSDAGHDALLIALENGHQEMASILRTALPNASEANTRRLSLALLAAASGGLEIEIDTLLKEGAEIDFPDSTGNTPLMLAIWNGHEDAAKRLIDRGADINLADEDGSTALHYTAIRGQERLANGLIEAGALVTQPDKWGLTALHFASALPNSDLAKKLIAAGAEVNVGAQISPALFRSSLPPDLRLTLTIAGFQSNPQRGRDSTPLHFAAATGNSLAVEALLSAGANPNAQTAGGVTPLHLSSQAGWRSAAGALLDAAADPNAQTDDGSTPLTLAQRDHSDITDFLVANGAEMFSRTYSIQLLRLFLFGMSVGVAVLIWKRFRRSPLQQQRFRTVLLSNAGLTVLVATLGYCSLDLNERAGFWAMDPSWEMRLETADRGKFLDTKYQYAESSVHYEDCRRDAEVRPLPANPSDYGVTSLKYSCLKGSGDYHTSRRMIAGYVSAFSLIGLIAGFGRHGLWIWSIPVLNGGLLLMLFLPDLLGPLDILQKTLRDWAPWAWAPLGGLDHLVRSVTTANLALFVALALQLVVRSSRSQRQI